MDDVQCTYVPHCAGSHPILLMFTLTLTVGDTVCYVRAPDASPYPESVHGPQHHVPGTAATLRPTGQIPRVCYLSHANPE